MKTRGRKTSFDGAVVIAGNFPRRPEPAEGLTERQAAIWREVVSTEDPKFFASGALRHVLADYCRHREAADRINELVNKSLARSWSRQDVRALGRLRTLLQMRESETRSAASLATKLRLTNQSRFVPQAAGRAGENAPKGRLPWETHRPEGT